MTHYKLEHKTYKYHILYIYTQEKERKNKFYIIFYSFIDLHLQKSKIILTKMDDPFILWRNPHSAGMQIQNLLY